ncbi:c-type cytochrome [Kineobactrum salinum]|uniref:Cytochrome C n=1 Tax=Kineobactrum salinum TaxID=2708301 RepID=A0A6C0U6I1_9GAMM|nr:cytochrome C [Kineobactrum salinum]QIB66547.1 cytochrome C [Kineobactrum salinum]
MRLKLLAGLLLTGGLLQPSPGALADTGQWLQSECGSCHALEQPDYPALGHAERLTRKGPPLYYAGNKFHAGWLESWLQDPVRIRPAGVFPPGAVVPSEEGDLIDPANLEEHLVLDANQAKKAADYLMALRPHDELIAATSYEPGSVARRMGELNFTKFNGCDACHSDGPGYGGLSGPELYTAWQRLQPGFIASFIADPAAWDPHTLMPKTGLNDSAVERLANYLKLIGEEAP